MKYRPTYVFAAIGLVVAIVVVAAIADPTGKTPIYIGAIAPILALFGILAYQWAWASSQRPPMIGISGPADLDTDLGQNDDYWQMYEAMAVKPIDREAVKRSQEGMTGMIKANIGLAALIGILPIAAAVMVISGRVPDFGDGGFLVLAPLLLAPLGLLWARFMMARAGSSGGAMLEPLGLHLIEMPKVGIGYSGGSATGMGARTSGASVMEGERHGRRVRISLGERHETSVAGRFARFELGSKGGRLDPAADAPTAVVDLISALGPSPHWRKLQSVKGGAEGIAVERGVDSNSGWLWDLWLAERLASALGG